MPKTVLFVTYGGGHARMVIPVMRALSAADPALRQEALALTMGGPIFAGEGMPYKGFKDFMDPDDTEALKHGNALAALHHSPESGIEEAESVAYLGLSYHDLAVRHGDAAAQLWREKGRHAFLPMTVMERVMDRIRPDMVVTTNSPKSEQAAVSVARKRGIPTLSMTDLFGIHHFHALEADTITVLCPPTIEHMRAEGVDKPDNAFAVTGNPAFDLAFDHRGPVDRDFRKTHFPQLLADKPMLLWIDMPAYWNLAKRELHTRSDAEILHDLDTLSEAAAQNGGSLLIRPHPSQPRALYDRWLAAKPRPHAAYAGGLPLYPLLKAVDVTATYTSTVSVEALLMQRKLIQLKYQPGRSDMPLGEWRIAWQADHPGELATRLHSAFYDEEEWQCMQSRIRSILPQEKAAPKIAELIRQAVR